VHRSLVPLPPPSPTGAPKCITIGGTPSTNTPRDCRTLNVARLERGGDYPSVRAARYVNRPVRSEGISEVVESPAAAVMHIAAVVVHTLAPYPLDEGDPGRHYACLAEKLLVACFVGRYVFPAARLRSRSVQDRCVAQAAGRDNRGRYRRRRKRERERERDEARRGLVAMAKNQPPLALTWATLVVGRGDGTCRDCRLFFRQVSRHFGLQVELVKCADGR
jgi:hypothetical protein